ncbi:hypothetical protein NP493_1143g00016 [Ridgeia piscesae]|uniref:Uncharacterized protein n=1 Tax=Ridgeia piscesae TaxID=27915 RepID=A0AAD9KH92_RIDPI|nr:hypothetical protein NP493_1143g00016 [Ridgeia piscesae]
MALNYDKTKQMRICFKKETPYIPPITINDIQIEQVHSTRLLGVTISQDLTWQLHIDDSTTKASQRLYFVILLKRAGIEPHHLVKIYTTIIRSVIESACQVWHTSLTIRQTNLLKSIQKKPCALYVVECVIMTPSLLREYQRWQTGERRCADPCSRGCSKPTTSCTISCRPLRHVTTLFVTLALTVFLAVRPIASRTLVPYGLYNWQ